MNTLIIALLILLLVIVSSYYLMKLNYDYYIRKRINYGNGYFESYPDFKERMKNEINNPRK